MPVDYPATEDQVLLAHIVNRQTEALSALYDRYGRLLYSVAYHLVGNQQLAEEITLDVFRRVWEKAGSYKADRASVRTWLTSMTRNRAIDMLRREGVRPEHTSISWADLTFEPHADGHSPETAVSQKMQNQRIHAALAELPEEQQEEKLKFQFTKAENCNRTFNYGCDVVVKRFEEQFEQSLKE